jgi:hypothetical protein
MSMTDHERWHKDAGHRDDALDRELDTALATYAAVEPRTGLEERVLANLRAEPEQLARRSWWGWTVAGALAVVVVVISALLSLKPTNNVGKHYPSSEAPRAAGTQIASNRETNGTGPRTWMPGKRSSVRLRRTEKAAEPKLDVFPSPLPLSEQEKMLASYVSEYPKEAALIAQLRTEALQREFEEEMRTEETNSVR